MAGVCLKILLLWAGIIAVANSVTQAPPPPPPQCSYTVTLINSGFKINMMINSTRGNYIINFTDKGRKESTVESFSGTSHEIRHLKPCTEYELSVANRDNAGYETLCNSTESKIKTTGMNPSDITQTAPTGLPAKIKPELPERCTNLTIDYTCQDELSNMKNESELEPFTDYTCTGQIKNNNVPINQITSIKFRIDCDLTIKTELSPTSTTIYLTWTMNSMNCPVLPRLPNLSYDCSCAPPSKHKLSVPVDKTQTGGKCRFTGLDPYTKYECTVQPKYNNKEVQSLSPPVTNKTEAAEPEGSPDVTWTNPEHNVVKVVCTHGKQLNGPDKKYSARLYYNGELQEEKPKVPNCNFDFKDLSYLTEYTVEVFVFNGELYGNPEIITVTTSYSTALIIRSVVFIIVSVALAVVVCKIYIQRRRKSRNEVNDDMMLESTGGEDYASVHQYENSG